MTHFVSHLEASTRDFRSVNPRFAQRPASGCGMTRRRSQRGAPDAIAARPPSRNRTANSYRSLDVEPVTLGEMPPLLECPRLASTGLRRLRVRMNPRRPVSRARG